MIDVNMLPRELTGYVGHVCGLWFGSYFIDFRRIHCGERSARSPVTLACRTGTSWPQRGGTVRRCSTITTCPVAG